MQAAQVTALTSAFDPSVLLTTFIALAPFILGVLGVVIGIQLVKWGVKLVRKRTSGGIS